MAGKASIRPTIVGKVLGHYCITEKIGEGGMGEVYRARDQRLDRDVAIKVLPWGTFSGESTRKQFRKEALALSRLNHPNIETIHDFDSDNDVDFLVTEYIAGEGLNQKLVSGALPEEEIVRLGIQLADALAAAHEQGVIHRDLKPANIRITADGWLKILDFGLAKLYVPVSSGAVTASMSESMRFAGTLPYMAPEQVRGEKLDARTDIWAAGAVLFEMATGHRPFAAPGLQVTDEILHKHPSAPSSLNPHVSPALDATILKCLKKDPTHRYYSAREIGVDLRRAGTPSPHHARRVSPRSTALAFAAAFVVVGLIGFAWHIYHKSGGRSAIAPSIAVLPFSDLSPGHDRDYFSDGLAEEILNDLATMPNIKVVARTSAFQFKGKNEDLRLVAKKLGVENVLEGSVRTDGTRVRVTAQLVKADDGFHVWSSSYDRDLKDIFSVQEEIAKSVTVALRVKLLAGKVASPVPSSRTTNVTAYQEFLQARYFARRGDKQSAKQALKHIDNVIQSDPNYAPAYAWRGDLTLDAGGMVWLDYSDAIAKARRDIERAIELDPNLADGYRVLSMMQSLADSNCPAAKVTLQRALDLAPGDADNIGQSGFLEMCLGRQEEAVELLKQAVILDPLEPGRYLKLAQNLRDLGRYNESKAALERAVELNPRIVWAHETLGEVYLAQGRPREALEEVKKEPVDFLQALGFAIAYHALRREQESDAALATLITRYPNDCAYQIAQVYAYRGDKDRAFEWLARAYRQHDGGLMLTKTDLLLKGLREDPRYPQFLRTLNIAY
jgi:serine/threonine protein kinase/Tfp pilus assembly protein PilF